MTTKQATVLVVGPLPPPHNGVTTATELVLQKIRSPRLRIVHLDTADRRGLGNVGRLDAWNVFLAMVHFTKIISALAVNQPRIVYICVSQGLLGYLRDCLFMIPTLVARRQMVIHLHGGFFDSFYAAAPKWLRLLIRVTAGRSARAIVLGECLKRCFAGIVPPERLRVVPNGIDPAVYRLMPSSHQPSRTVLFLGTVMRSKGFMEVLQAAPRVLSKTDASFRFVGEFCYPEERAEAEQFVADHRLQGRVEFTGVKVGPDKMRVLADAALLAFPTRYPFEGQPFVILEAMMAGLPVITTARGAIPDMVIDGETGFIVPEGDTDALADRIVALLEDEQTRARVAEQARLRAVSLFTDSHFAERLAAVFLELV